MRRPPQPPRHGRRPGHPGAVDGRVLGELVIGGPNQNRAPGGRAKLLRVDRPVRRGRSLALADWIDHPIRGGEVADLAAVARTCEVSRARVTAIVDLLGMA